MGSGAGSGAGKGEKGGKGGKGSKGGKGGKNSKGGKSKKEKKKRETDDEEQGGGGGLGSDEAELMAMGQKYERAGNDPFVNFIVGWKFITTVGAINMIIVQFVGGLSNDDIEVFPAVARVYVVIFCAFVIMNEMGLGKKLTGGSSLFSNWIVRGLFYAYIGLVGLEQNVLASEATGIYAKVVAWYMIVCGGMYLTLGACCLELYYNSIVPDFDEIAGDLSKENRDKAKRVADKYGG
jgi:hypothetical protein